jgi:hypothetical protein
MARFAAVSGTILMVLRHCKPDGQIFPPRLPRSRRNSPICRGHKWKRSRCRARTILASVVSLIEGRATHVGAATDHPGKATWMEARFTGLDPRTEMCRIQLFNASALIAGHSPRSVRNPRPHRRGGMGELYRDRDTKLKREVDLRPDNIVQLPSRGRTRIFRPTACGYPTGLLRSPPQRKRASFMPGAFSTIPI